MTNFLKSASTSTPVANSKAEIERILRRYGADGLSVAQNYGKGTVMVSFLVPNSPEKGAPLIPVKLPVDVRRVYDKLNHGRNAKHTTEVIMRDCQRDWAQAERVAWRNLVLWIDAALSAATAGLQTITEAFFAHAVLGHDGQRVIDVAEAGEPIYKQLTAGASHD